MTQALKLISRLRELHANHIRASKTLKLSAKKIIFLSICDVLFFQNRLKHLTETKCNIKTRIRSRQLFDHILRLVHPAKTHSEDNMTCTIKQDSIKVKLQGINLHA